MYKSSSLDSLRLQTSSSDFILTSTTNQDANASSAKKSGGRKAILPTPNRPINKGSCDTVQFSSNDDTVVEKVNYSQPENKDNISQDDDNSFESFIRANFVPFSGKQSLYEWLDETEDLFNRFKISCQFRYKAIPLLIQGDAKRKYIKYRRSITSFDDFYEFLMTHYDTIPSVSIQTQADLTSESVKSFTANDKPIVELKTNVTNTTDSSQLLKSPVSFPTNVVDKDTTNTSGDVSILKSAMPNFDNSSMSFEPVVSDLRKAIVTDFIKHPKIFRGAKDDVIKWVDEIDHLMQIAHVPECSRLDLISYSLRGDALQWFKNNKGSLTCWNVFVQEIKKSFTSSFSEELAFKTLESYSQGENQSVRNFYNEILKLCNAADSSMSESTKLKNLLNKVKPTIQLEVRKRKPKSPAEFLEFAKETEELLQLSNISIDRNIRYNSEPMKSSVPKNSWNNISSNRYNNSHNHYSSNTQRNSWNNPVTSSSTSFSSHSSKLSKPQAYHTNQHTSSTNSKTSTDNNRQQIRTQQYQNSSKSRTKSNSRLVNAIASSDLSAHDISINSSDSSTVLAEPSSDGVDSGQQKINPSKPSLIFINALVNKNKIRILVDTGATKSFINKRILHRIVDPHNTILKRPYSFLLADGVAPFHVFGSVNISIQFDNFITIIEAHIAENLCTDMIIGMDYINKYNLNIDVKKQIVIIQSNNRLIVVPIVNQYKSIKIPVVSSTTVSLPPNSKRNTCVSIPISSISLPFTSFSPLRHYTFIKNGPEILQFRNYHSNIVIFNSTMNPQIIKKGARLGYLFCSFTFQHPRVFRSSLYRSLGATRHAGMTPAFGDFVTDSSSNIDSSASCHTITKNSYDLQRSSGKVISNSPHFINPIVLQHIHSLVEKIPHNQQRQDLLSLLMRFHTAFDTTKHNIARTRIHHVINTIPHSPPASRPYPQPDTEEAMYKLIQEFLKAGLITASHSPYAAPAILVKKKDKSFRLVVDYKRLNAITIKDSSPLPNMEDTIQKLGKGFSYFSKLDLKSGFYQIPINNSDKEKTAFVTPFGLYQFNVLPMGLRNSPPTFQKVMTDTLKACRHFCLVYLDDIIVFSRSFSDHLDHLKRVFSALGARGLVLNPPKCEIAVPQIDYLGHTISRNSIRPMKEKIDAILGIKEPRTLPQANRFLGSLGWYRKFLPNFATVAAPIHAVTNLTRANRRKFKWQHAQSEAFKELKNMLITEPLFLHYPVDNLPLILTTDASDIGIGGVLQQEVNGNIHNLYYHSQVITPCERKYSAIEKEALAIFKCVQRMRSFILGRNLIIMTDHCPLCFIMQKSIKNARVNRITHLIQEYNIDKVVHIQGRYNCLPDYLSRYSKEQDDDLFDIEYGLGSKSNSISSSSISNSINSKLLASMTLRPRKNQVKYTDDSVLIQKDTSAYNRSDDVSNSKNIHRKKLSSSISRNFFDVTKLKAAQDQDIEIQNIIRNLSSAHHQASFVLEDNILYKIISFEKSSNQKFKVVYLPSSMIHSLLQACHDDPISGSHFSTDRMYYKIRNQFWWPRMRTIIQRYVKNCRLCIQFNLSRNKKHGHLRSIPLPEGPFALIGMDYCGPLPRTPRENQYVLVITDYFTRYITAVALPNCTAETTAEALFNEYFCKFGIPSVILSDRGSHFQNKLMENLQKLIGYNHIYSTSYHPQTNGVVERFNATFVAQISKLQNSQSNNWDEFLQPVVFAYNTGVHKSTKFSPYELVYGRPARLPIHAQSTQFTFNKPIDYFEQLKKTLRIFHQASKNNILLQQQASQTYYNRHRLNPHLAIGDKVLTRIFGSRAKLDPKFSSIPKIVVETRHPTYIVEDENTHVRSQVHINDLRPIMSY
ncbi:unnamed protein product [Rotaria magnacalcarata]|uniref:Endonuclease n=3 Tax=Rotaria magnacalcarata TaxID=392030 RepID=A0A815C334_9BILA|nr:unnamed protein product [Rotaria magnacalcarata]CAF3967591.1 unnamed protein product [Rotaria magnacalcarata]